MNTQQPRQPAGITVGGQFATEPKQETTVALVAPTPPVTTPCELCGAPAVTGFQAYTPRGKVGEPVYACEEHRRAPTYASFGGGWYKRVPLPAVAAASPVQYVVTARWHDGSTVYLSYEVDMSQRPTLTRYDEPKPMAERSARRTLRLAERHGEDEMTDVRMEPA